MKISFSLFFLIIGLSLYSQDNATLSKLEATYKGYLVSCNKHNGKKAASYLDQHSKVFFELLLNHLWYADSITIEGLSHEERFLILLIRQMNTPEQVLSFRPNSFAIYVLSEVGPPGVTTPEGFTLGSLREESPKAYARLMVKGNPIDPEYEFTKENGRWKISLFPFMDYGEISLARSYKWENHSDKAFNIWLIEAFTGKPVDPDIWMAVKD